MEENEGEKKSKKMKRNKPKGFEGKRWTRCWNLHLKTILVLIYWKIKLTLFINIEAQLNKKNNIKIKMNYKLKYIK